MNNRTLQSLAAALVIALIFFIAWLVSSPALAGLGNQGIPVRCAPDTADELIPNIDPTSFSCVAADGTAFEGGQGVPTGYYLLVTDIVLSHELPTSGNVPLGVVLYNVDAEDQRGASLRLQAAQGISTVANFTTPYLVLPGGHRLEGELANSSGDGAYVYVSGLLVTNLAYLPMTLGE